LSFINLNAQTTVTFDDQGWVDEEIIGTSVTLSNYTFSATETGSSIDLKVDNGNSFSGLALVANNVNFVDGDVLSIVESSGDDFSFQSFHYSGADFITSLTINGYSDGSLVATQVNNSPGSSATETLNSNFENVDEIRIEAGGGFGLLANFDQFVFNQATLGINNYEITKPSIFPNPTNDYITLSFNETQDSIKIRITNLQGQEIESRNYNKIRQVKLDFRYYFSGIYFVKITNTKFNNEVFKILKR